jgi:3-oxoacyl-[acyl-carrier-protein] synthase II
MDLAVTGAGVASPVGIGRAAFVEAMRSGARPALPGRPTTFDASKYAGTLVAEVRDFDASRYLGDKGLRALDRLTKLLVVAARLALHDAGLKRDGAWAASSPERVGIVASNAYGSLEAITELDRVATLEDARYINPSRFPLTVSNSAAGYVSIWEDLRALNVSVSDGNCGALDAVACAHVLLDQARADALLVGGAEAMSEALALAFDRLGAVSAAKGRAFLGEGAALLVVEPLAAARVRGAHVLCTIAGYGTAFEPPRHEATLLCASPEAVERSIGLALDDAGIGPGDVDAVFSGISGLRAFDEAEMQGILRAVGDGACVLAPKRALGETLGAAGAMAMLAAATLLGDGVAAHVVRGSLRAAPRTALVTSLGYYGNASALVMRHPAR